MPVEGQWRRVRTPLRTRERRVLAAAAALAVVAAVVAVVALGFRGGPARKDCVVFSVPSTMGGADLRECGPAARRFCATEARKDVYLAETCRAQGFLPRR